LGQNYEPQTKKSNFKAMSFLDTGTNSSSRVPSVLTSSPHHCCVNVSIRAVIKVMRQENGYGAKKFLIKKLLNKNWSPSSLNNLLTKRLIKPVLWIANPADADCSER